MRVFITGGCGYLGYSIVEQLLPQSNVKEIVVYDNLSRRETSFFFARKFPQAHKLRFVEGDILDNYKLERKLKGMDVVVHAAARVYTPFADYDSHSFDQINNWGTGLVASQVEKTESVKRVVYLSSTSVYGNTSGEPVNEGSAPAGKSFYGVSKLRGEKHLQRLADKKEVFILRLGNVFGYNPATRLDAVINRFMFEAQAKGKIEIHGNGEQQRAFAEVEQTAELIVQCILGAQYKPETYNVIHYNLSINDIAEAMRKLYPDLDLMFLDQHLEMNSISVTSKHEMPAARHSLETHLEKFKQQFSY
ncbi:MAG: SDR family oxidoreductase [Bacteroidota bacterium]